MDSHNTENIETDNPYKMLRSKKCTIFQKKLL